MPLGLRKAVLLVGVIGAWNRLIGPSRVGVVGCLGYALLIFPSPRALAEPAPSSVAMALVGNQGAGIQEGSAHFCLYAHLL